MTHERKPEAKADEGNAFIIDEGFLGDGWRELLGEDFSEDEILEEAYEEHEISDLLDESLDNESGFETLAIDERSRAQTTTESLRQEALRIPKGKVEAFTWNAILVKQNVDHAFALMEEFLPEVKSRATEETYRRGIRIRETALALVYTAAIAARSSPPGVPTFRDGMAQIYSLRRLFMYSALAQAEKNKVDKKALARIRAGGGSVDAIGDTVALANFYLRAHWHRQKSIIDMNDLRLTFNLARTLYPQIKVKGAKKPPVKVPEPIDENAELRNRMWSLLKEDWNHFYILATLHFKSSVAEVLPKLKSYARIRRAATPEAEEVSMALKELEGMEEDDGLGEDEEV